MSISTELTIEIRPGKYLDQVAIERRIAGDHTVRLSIAERVEAVRQLNTAGHSDGRIARQLGYAKETIMRIRHRHHIPASGAHTGNRYS